MKQDTVIGLFVIAVIVALPILGALAFYAKVSTCGWKGLFVECRIVDCPR